MGRRPTQRRRCLRPEPPVVRSVPFSPDASRLRRRRRRLAAADLLRLHVGLDTSVAEIHNPVVFSLFTFTVCHLHNYFVVFAGPIHALENTVLMIDFASSHEPIGVNLVCL